MFLASPVAGNDASPPDRYILYAGQPSTNLWSKPTEYVG